MRVHEVEPCQPALELHVLPWIVAAGAVVGVGAFDEHRYREQGGDEYLRVSLLSSLSRSASPNGPTTLARDYLPGSKRSRHSYGWTWFSGFHTKYRLRSNGFVKLTGSVVVRM